MKELSVPKVLVRRDGHLKEVPAKHLVPGDIVILETGNLIPADCRLLESVNLRVQESALTGESEPVSKHHERLESTQGDDVPLAERTNMVYMGSVVTYGRGVAVVISTGMETELGKIAEMMQSTEDEDTPLQKKLSQLGKGLAVATIILVLIIIGLGLLRGEDFKLLLLTSISIAVAAIPEGLPAIVTISLAMGARRMLQKHALIRRLPAVEALGSVTVICSDKTGTLTKNEMTVTVLDVADNRIELKQDVKGDRIKIVHENDEEALSSKNMLESSPALTLLLAGGALCNDALLDTDKQGRVQIVGDPTEGALVVAALKMEMDKPGLEKIMPRVDEIPFDSERKRMTTVHRRPQIEDIPERFLTIWDWEKRRKNVVGDYVIFTKGAIDGLVEISQFVWVNDHEEELNDEWKKRILEANKKLAMNGMRVLGVATKVITDREFCSEDTKPEEKELVYERELVFVGLIGMIDPARPEVKDAIATCKTAGIRPIMITGDHPLTASYIAKELQITDNELVVTGKEIEELSDEELIQEMDKASVFARVAPKHKLRIVDLLQRLGNTVSMTGDGVNDAPALKKADIGVAMGITGTDVSNEAADMVLLDDNFATIVAAVEEGRVIYDNIRKFIQYTLSSNVGEIWIMLLSPFLGMPIPLQPLQILWINLVTDGLPGLALGVEKGERDTMKRPPYPPSENVFARGLGINVLWVGLLMSFVSIIVGFAFWKMGSPHWQTMVFTTITFSEMGYVLAIRSNIDSIFKIGFLSNRYLVGAVLLTIFLQLLLLYVPFLQTIFATTALPAGELILCFVLSTVVFWAVEVQKWFIRRRR